MSGIRHHAQIDMRIPPTEATHIVRMGDMMEYVAGLTKEAVRAVLTSTFAGTYDSGALTLTQSTPAPLVVDGIALDASDRVLLVGQLDLTQNGIYTVTIPGDGVSTAAVLTRSEDFDASTDLVNGTVIPVTEGTENAGTKWKFSPATIPAVLDTTNLIFTQVLVDLARIVEMTFDIEGDTTTTLYQLEHNLNSMHITHEIYDNATGETVIAQFRRTSLNDVEVEVGVPLGVGNNLTLVLRTEVEPQ